MLIGVPKEIKPQECRVGLTPNSVRELTSYGHKVLVETSAGASIGFSDQDYQQAGAEIAGSAQSVYAVADLIVKVKEPQASEFEFLQPNQILFTYLHLAPDPAQAAALLKAGVVAIAYETVTDERGGLPLLAPMSEVAGRMSVQAGVRALEKSSGGSGILLGGVPGVLPAKVFIIGGGVVGTQAAKMAVGLGADVLIADRSLPRLRQLDETFGGRISTLFATQAQIEECLPQVDVVIGAVLVPGAAAPKVITKAMLARMKSGSVLVDVAIDQGGCFETSRPTTHDSPTFVEQGVIHYCVTNMPGAVARTSTLALNNATLPYVIALAQKGWQRALLEDQGLCQGLNICAGYVTHAAVAQSLQLDFVSSDHFLKKLSR